MDESQKGTDHKLSLEPNEFKQMISFIRGIELIRSNEIMSNGQILDYISRLSIATELNDVKSALNTVFVGKKILDCEMPCRMKLGKSLVYRNSLISGATLTEDDICAKVNEPFGISAEHFDKFVGQILIKDVRSDENLDDSHFQHW